MGEKKLNQSTENGNSGQEIEKLSNEEIALDLHILTDKHLDIMASEIRSLQATIQLCADRIAEYQIILLRRAQRGSTNISESLKRVNDHYLNAKKEIRDAHKKAYDEKTNQANQTS